MLRQLLVRQPHEPTGYMTALAGYDGPFLSERSEATLEECADEGRLFVVSEGEGEGAEVVAVAGVFQPGDGSAWELGGTLVKESARGFGLQRLLLASRVAHVEFFRGEDDDAVFASVAADNAASIQNLERSGFVEWLDPPQAVLDYKAERPLPGGAARKYFCLHERSATAMLIEVADMLRTSEGVQLHNRKGETLTVTLDVTIAKAAFRDDFLAFVESRRG